MSIQMYGCGGGLRLLTSEAGCPGVLMGYALVMALVFVGRWPLHNDLAVRVCMVVGRWPLHNELALVGVTPRVCICMLTLDPISHWIPSEF